MNKIFNIIISHLWANKLFDLFLKSDLSLYFALALLLLITVGYFVKLRRD